MIHFDTVKDISKNTNLLMTIPSLGDRQHSDALKTKKKVQIPNSRVLETSVLAIGP